MEAFKCDICKNYYDDHEHYKHTYRDINPARVYPQNYTVRLTIDQTGDRKQLCKNCLVPILHSIFPKSGGI